MYQNDILLKCCVFATDWRRRRYRAPDAEGLSTIYKKGGRLLCVDHFQPIRGRLSRNLLSRYTQPLLNKKLVFKKWLRPASKVILTIKSIKLDFKVLLYIFTFTKNDYSRCFLYFINYFYGRLFLRCLYEG